MVLFLIQQSNQKIIELFNEEIHTKNIKSVKSYDRKPQESSIKFQNIASYDNSVTTSYENLIPSTSRKERGNDSNSHLRPSTSFSQRPYTASASYSKRQKTQRRKSRK